MDGSKFDSSKDRGRPFQFVIGQGMVKGLGRGHDADVRRSARQAHVHSRLRLRSPRIPPVIPPNSTLIFEVELLGVQ